MHFVSKRPSEARLFRSRRRSAFDASKRMKRPEESKKRLKSSDARRKKKDVHAKRKTESLKRGSLWRMRKLAWQLPKLSKRQNWLRLQSKKRSAS